MKTKTILWTAVVLIFLSFIAGVYIYGQMPEQMASHWDANGNVNGYMPKFWAIFLMPIITLGIFLILLLVPKIDPLKKNIQKFIKYFNGFILLIVIFLFYVHLLTLFWNLGYRFDMNLMIIPVIAILFYYIGMLLKYAKRNWFIGIRTPWTLSNDVVWDKTHKLGARIFKLSAIIMLLGLLLPDSIIWIVIGIVILGTLYLVLYSYLEYRKIKKK